MAPDALMPEASSLPIIVAQMQKDIEYLRVGMGELKDSINNRAAVNTEDIKVLRAEQEAQNRRIRSLENWRWMLTGAMGLLMVLMTVLSLAERAIPLH